MIILHGCWVCIFDTQKVLEMRNIGLTPHNYPAFKISGHFIHWGPFYGTPLSENLDFAPPLYIKSYVLISYLMRSLKLKQFVNVCVGVLVYALGWHWPSRQICYSLCTSNFIFQRLKQIPTWFNKYPKFESIILLHHHTKTCKHVNIMAGPNVKAGVLGQYCF